MLCFKTYLEKVVIKNFFFFVPFYNPQHSKIWTKETNSQRGSKNCNFTKVSTVPL